MTAPARLPDHANTLDAIYRLGGNYGNYEIDVCAYHARVSVLFWVGLR